MSPVSLGLDGLLILLLSCAMAIGWRLNGKLKDLKESQVGFIKAVGELDQAAIRAENGLEALRAATVDAHDQLLTRIETARGLSARLDRVLPEAEAAAASADAAAEAARYAADMARRATARAAVVAPTPAPQESATVVTLPIPPRQMQLEEPESPEITIAPESPGVRAAALFLEERARRAAPEPASQTGTAEPNLSRLARFKARRAGGRA